LVVDAAALYERLGKAVEATLSERESRGVEWGVTQTHRLHLALREVGLEVGLRELSMPAQDVRPFVKNGAEVLAHVRKILQDADGVTLNKLYIEELTMRAARSIRYNGSTAPVFIINADQSEVYSLGQAFGKGAVTVPVTAEDEINKEFLGKTLKEVSSRNSKKSNKKQAEGEA
jgi:hypothetical protein